MFFSLANIIMFWCFFPLLYSIYTICIWIANTRVMSIPCIAEFTLYKLNTYQTCSKYFVYISIDRKRIIYILHVYRLLFYICWQSAFGSSLFTYLEETHFGFVFPLIPNKCYWKCFSLSFIAFLLYFPSIPPVSSISV